MWSQGESNPPWELSKGPRANLLAPYRECPPVASFTGGASGPSLRRVHLLSTGPDGCSCHMGRVVTPVSEAEGPSMNLPSGSLTNAL